MNSIVAHSRQQHRDLAQDLVDSHTILAVDAAVPTADGPVTEVTVKAKYDAVPPRLLAIVADHGFAVRDVSPQGEPAHLRLEVV